MRGEETREKEGRVGGRWSRREDNMTEEEEKDGKREEERSGVELM